ncbi:nicotinate-nucleotide adenylyltransferase [Zavarzinella formosa]|uniref:nicotinate-nucleotide adenylyltransferase n=1 Tax=Zavarzinella formosa TaxID=360055 RepID=UPI0002E3D36A|nr:nicotinate-nucleotide adenylyltransferase [Zavarzinella formosa]
MRIGIFGGTFDPVHTGHLIMAELAREQGRLDQLWFVPSYKPPHKQEQEIAPFDRRVDMLNFALAGQEEKFRVDLIEQQRPGLSYTTDTLAALHEQHPGNEWFLLLGADCLPDLPKWHEPKALLKQAALLTVARPGHTQMTAEQLAASIGITPEEVRLQAVQVPLIDISSRDLRRRVREDRSIMYQVPRAVEVYIRERKLYR